MNFFQKLTGHFSTITRHRHKVIAHCAKAGILWQGLRHDLSKYTPTEFIPGVKYYMGDRSPNEGERMDKGYSKAWLHHKGRNKHHYEYWIDYSVDPGEGIIGLKMPLQYVVEMFMDRIAASKTYQGDAYRDSHPLEYYEKGAGRLGKMIHPDTAGLLHELLKMLAEEGEEKTFRYIKRVLLKQKKY